MKKTKVFKNLFAASILLGSASAIVIPSAILIPMNTNNQKAISKDLKVYEISKPTSTTSLSDFKVSNINLEKAIYGSTSIDNGTYMIGYMTLSNVQGTDSTFAFPSTVNNWNWIQSLKMGTGNAVITKNLDQIIVNNAFLQAFYDESTELSKVAKFYLAVDVNPNIDKQIQSDSLHVPERFATPDSKWSQDLILDQFNYFHEKNPENEQGKRPYSYGTRPFIDEFDDLPKNEKDKDDQFIRNDSSANAYRQLTNFVQRWRPQTASLTSNTNLESGFIAYSQVRTANNEDESLNNQIKPLISTSIGLDNSSVQSIITQLKSYYLNEEE